MRALRRIHLVARDQVRLTTIVLIVLVLGLGQVALSYRTSMVGAEADEWVGSTISVLSLASITVDYLGRMETDYRSYLLSGDPTFLDSYQKCAATVSASLSQLEGLAADDPDLAAHWRTAGQMLRAWRYEIADPAVAAREAGQTASPRLRESSRRMTVIRDELSQATASERAQLQVRKRAQMEANRTLQLVLLFGTPLALLGTVAGMVTLVRGLQRERLRGVQLAARTAMHEINNRLTEVTSNAQLLTRDVRLTGNSLQRAVDIRDSAFTIANVVRSLETIVSLDEHDWGPVLGTTIRIAPTLPEEPTAEHSRPSLT